MSEDLPYMAEYAKSGRAGCKGCKMNIAQDSLRIARMVQSPHFDGKVPQWYHFRCFFQKFKPKSCSDIGKFDTLRWDDQEKVRAKFTGSATVKDEVDGPSCNNNNSDFQIEYAKSGRAKCRQCEEKIEKGVIRISKLMEPEEVKFARGPVPHWHHVKCFVERKTELDAGDLAATDIPGFTSLNDEDQKSVLKQVGTKKKKASKKKKIAAEQKKEPVAEEKLSEEAKKLKEQNEKFWKIRDQLFTTCSNAVLRSMLEANNYDSTGGESKILDSCADGMMFGALETCPDCDKGRLTYKSEGYACTGNISGWTRCVYVTHTPKRKMWKIPIDLKEDNDFLSKFKLKIRERKFPASAVAQLKKQSSTSNKPLENKKIVLVGKLKQTKVELRSKVEELGGTLTDSVNKSCFCCISSPGEVLKSGKKMQTVEANDIPVVAEEYIDAVTKGGAELLLTQYAIAPWGGNHEPTDETDGKASGSRKRKIEKSSAESSKKAKLTMKGGAIVDPDSGKEDTCHVLSFRNELYNAVLGMVDLVRGTNSYYKVQVLKHDTKKNKFYVFRAWGRVGTTIGGNKLESFNDREDAIWNFKDVYEEKTGNSWHNRKNFVKQPSRFYPLDIDYGQEDETLQSSVAPGSLSKLTNPVKELIKLIFDVEAMKHALVEFEIDLKKMPLGKLSKKQIETAYACLGECQKCVTDGVTGSKVLDASNRFFTLIPHDFGMKKPPLLDNSELINLKIKMLDSLLEIEIAYSLLKGSKGDAEKDPLDLHYESLKADIHEIEKSSEEFLMIKEYVKNTHAKTHGSYSLDLDEVFSVVRQGERQRYRPFKDLPNRQLLWHGSRTTNYAGILSQGLRIAPPEAPVTGYMFGKGVYFADMASKSANYCNTTRSNNTGLMLLCEVALGNMYELKKAEHVTKLPAGKHSCKGLGKTGPDPDGNKVLKDGTVVPMGVGKSTDVKSSSLLYNEYIVYDVAQLEMKYLVKLKFNYKY